MKRTQHLFLQPLMSKKAGTPPSGITPKGTRTPVTGMRTRRPRPLDDGGKKNSGEWIRTTDPGLMNPML